jgi:hypothetical protein
MRYALICLVLPFTLMAQTYGPNSPSASANVATTGNIPWQNPSDIYTSNDVYATVQSYGSSFVTHYLNGTDFNFNLLNTDLVSGIQVEIEKSAAPPQNVVQLDPWTIGNSRSVSAGNNRCMIVFIAQENTTDRSATSITYGGQDLYLYTGSGVFYGFSENFSMWYMPESQLTLASGTNFVVTYSGPAAANTIEILASAVYANVDQGVPINFADSDLQQNATSPFQMSVPIETVAGGMSVTGVFSNDPPNPVQPLGNCDAFSVDNGFTETLDYYTDVSGIPGSGGVLQVSQKSNLTTGTEQPNFTFSGAANHYFFAEASLNPAGSDMTDVSMYLLKNGSIVGVNHADNTLWPATDTYIAYGGIADQWGTTWLYSDINNANFGAAISASIQNTQIQVDHMRITVYTTSVLPLELVHFKAAQNGDAIVCEWLTASELNSDVFIVERSSDGAVFQPAGMLEAAGNSITPLRYSFTDREVIEGINYYRLKMVSSDGTITYSDIISAPYVRKNSPQIYPNPASDWTTVLTPRGFDEILITKADGTIIDRIKGSSMETKQRLNVYGMPDGMYFLCIKSADGMIEIRQFMKTSKTL